MLTAVEGTRFYRGLQYFRPAIYNTRYVFWHGGTVPDGPPAYAFNMQPPSIWKVQQQGIFCAGIPNLFLRAVGKRVPTRGNPLFDGGVAAYFGDNRFGPGYFEGFMEPFDLNEAKKWAADTRSGVLIGRRFVWTATGQVASQGHAAILMPSGFVLQAAPFHQPASGRDTNWDYRIDQSHDDILYQVMVHPRNWINYEGDEF